MTTQIFIGAGTNIDRAAKMLVEAAKRGDGEAVGEFNGIELRATTNSTAQEIAATFERINADRAEAYRRSPEGIVAAERANERRSQLQSTHDALMARLPTIWGEPVAIVDWLCEMQAPSDHIGVIIKRETIAAAFAKHSYLPGMDCGDNFDPNSRASGFRYLVGQALDGIVNGPAIHPILHKFAAEWKERFGISRKV